LVKNVFIIAILESAFGFFKFFFNTS
jgi:hypothetical protein